VHHKVRSGAQPRGGCRVADVAHYAFHACRRAVDDVKSAYLETTCQRRFGYVGADETCTSGNQDMLT